MNSNTLYRKYRPKTFKEVVGQSHITQVLENSIKNSSFVHAYLFSGPHGVGKTSIARIFANEITKSEYNDDVNLDIIEIDAASNRRIDEIRDLKEKVNLLPIKASYKVYIIDEVHMLTKEAFNALLKTLEEPPSHVVFILATTELERLPPTIVSRTQLHNFKLYTDDEISSVVAKTAKSEGGKLSRSDSELIAKMSKGSIRDSLSILSKVMGSKGDMSEILGVPGSELIKELSQNIANSDVNESMSVIDEVQNRGLSLNVLRDELVEALLQHTASSAIDLAKALVDIDSRSNLALQIKVAIADALVDRTTANTYSEMKTPSQSEQQDDDDTDDDVNIIDQSEIIEEQDNTAGTEAQAAENTDNSKEEAPISKVVTKEANTAKMSTLNTDLEDKNFWPDFMNQVKKDDRSVYTVLRMVQPIIKGSKITLLCKYDLHYKKISEASFKSKVISKMREFGVEDLEVKVDESISTSNKSSDTEKNLKDIMGGGEVVKLGSTI